MEKALSSPFDLIILDVRLPVKEVDSLPRNASSGSAASHFDADRKRRVRGTRKRPRPRRRRLPRQTLRVGRVAGTGQSVLRRRRLIDNPVLKVDTLEIDTRSRTVRRGGEFIRLTAKEYALLECLTRDADRLLDRDTISDGFGTNL